MGQYWLPVNLDKKEYLNPHKLGGGLKLWEQLANPCTGRALVLLCAAMPMRRGGGDLDNTNEFEFKVVGRWAGDRIALVGDYAEDSDLDKKHKASTIFTRCDTPEGYQDFLCELTADVLPLYEGLEPYTDITDEVKQSIDKQLQMSGFPLPIRIGRGSSLLSFLKGKK